MKAKVYIPLEKAEADILIAGIGFYAIEATSDRGRAFMVRVEGNDNGSAYCDDSRLALDIADGALSVGLRVNVNGRQYGMERIS